MSKRLFGWILLISMAICIALLAPEIYKNGQFVYGRELAAVVICYFLMSAGWSLTRRKKSPVETLRLIRRRPWLLIAFASIGVVVGVALIGFYETWLIAAGVIVLIFYTLLLTFVAIKLRNRTWISFCDRLISMYEG
jgi:hypothetical protein